MLLLAPFGYQYLPVAADYVNEDSCIGCHRHNNSQLVVQWMSSAHFTAGVDCESCHGSDHSVMFAKDGDVSPLVCASCHEAAYREFARSHHAGAEASMLASARFQIAPASIQRLGCESCHAIGKTYDDGGVGQCNACHSAHRYSVQEAREPHACQGCHMGPDHPQIEAWEASKHGIVYAAVQDEEIAPTCATCHLGGETGHDDTRVLTLGSALMGAVIEGSHLDVGMKVITEDEFAEARGNMRKICRGCHSEGFASRHLNDADDIKRRADALVAEAVEIIRGLEKDGLLQPMPQDRPPHPQLGHQMVLGRDQLYSDTSVIEQELFEMMKFDHATTFKGAYHFSPDHTHALGWVRLQAALTRIRGEAARLRMQAETPTQ